MIFFLVLPTATRSLRYEARRLARVGGCCADAPRQNAPNAYALQCFGVCQLKNALLADFAVLGKRVYDGFLKDLELFKRHSEFNGNTLVKIKIEIIH